MMKGVRVIRAAYVFSPNGAIATPGYFAGMDLHTRRQHLPRKCDLCDRPMHLLGTLPPSARHPGQHIYKCTECKYATADEAPLRTVN